MSTDALYWYVNTCTKLECQKRLIYALKETTLHQKTPYIHVWGSLLYLCQQTHSTDVQRAIHLSQKRGTSKWKQRVVSLSQKSVTSMSKNPCQKTPSWGPRTAETVTQGLHHSRRAVFSHAVALEHGAPENLGQKFVKIGGERRGTRRHQSDAPSYYLCMFLCMYMGMYVCMYVCMCVCMVRNL